MNHGYCFNTACTMAEKCSHAIIFKNQNGSQETLVAINPKSLMTDSEGKCKHYCEPETIKIAHGMLKSTNNMPKGIYSAFVARMSSIYNRTDYYDMRSGKKPITPEHQATILEVVKKLGYEFPGSPWDSVTEDIRYFSV